ncbi:MAG: hypothetical protein ACRDJI_07215 [Actinomycetota bacterium]
MLDRAWRVLFRNFSTFFLVVGVITIPLHLVHSFAFRDVVGVAELHSEIEELPENLKVRGVGAEDLDRARIAYWVVTALEIALLPVLLGATRRVIEVDDDEGVPGVIDAYRHARARPPSALRPPPGTATTLIGAAAVGFAVGWLARAAGLLVVEPLGHAAAWAGVGLVEGGSRALGAVFFLVVVIDLARRAKGGRGDTPTLY